MSVANEEHSMATGKVMVRILQRTAIVSVTLLVVLWVASIWVQGGVVALGLQFELFPGVFAVSGDHSAAVGNYIRYSTARCPFRLDLFIGFERISGEYLFVCAAWMPVALLGIPVVIALVKTRNNASKGAVQCVYCGYDRSGLLVGSVCPECGRYARRGNGNVAG
jgi:hypothetical protein